VAPRITLEWLAQVVDVDPGLFECVFVGVARIELRTLEFGVAVGVALGDEVEGSRVLNDPANGIANGNGEFIRIECQVLDHDVVADGGGSRQPSA